jgi:DNA-directed RNA polymerase specialized sigma24 family protein
MVEMRTVKVTAQRVGKWWVLESEEAGSVSQCRTLAQVDEEMREAIAYQLGIPEDSFTVDVEVVLPEAYEDEMTRSEQLREEAAQASHEAVEARRRAAKELQELHMSVRDIGQVMGVSYQRAHQLVSA